MTDEGARRPTKPTGHVRLERQQRQHVIHVAPHGGGRAEKPLTARSASGNRLLRPRSAMALPPTPANVTGHGARSSIAPISEAPRRSPDSSPAMRKMRILFGVMAGLVRACPGHPRLLAEGP